VPENWYVTGMLLTFHSHPQYNSLINKTSMDHNLRVQFYILSLFIIDGNLLLPGLINSGNINLCVFQYFILY
jgi:hypothetical protein